jgi:outer membrane protein OmpA-like peptidoglycan-associated protein
MNMKYPATIIRSGAALLTLSMIFGCAGMERNTKQDQYPYYYIHKELQKADRAVAAARTAGKDKQCPVEFKAAEDLKNSAYSTYAACHTQEGIGLANQATAKADALCPPAPVVVSQPFMPVVIVVAEPQVEEKVAAVASEKQAEKVVILALEDVHFDFGQSSLTPEAKTILKKNIQLLKDNPKAKVRVAGYTSAAGTEDYNQKLSERRATAVKEYLIEEGVITRERLTKIGYGESSPATYESAPKNIYSPAAKSNMRVLFEIVLE